MTFLLIVFIIAGVVLGLLGGNCVGQKISSTQKTPPHRIYREEPCPFCGHSNAKFIEYGGNTPPDLVYKCFDCHRHYAICKESALSAVQRQLIKSDNLTCQRVEQISELNKLIESVTTTYHYNRHDSYVKSFHFGDGKVEFVKGRYNEKTFRTTLFTYPKTSDLGDRWLCFLCLKELRRKFPNVEFFYCGTDINYD